MEDSIGEPQRRKKISRFLYLLFSVIVIGSIILISRGTYISNALKQLILPELEDALHQKVIAKKIYINIFPFFIEAKNLKVFDENGKRILLAKRVKGYIEPVGLLRKQISIRRLVIKEPNISSDKEQINEAIESFNAYLKKKGKFPFKVKVKVVEIDNGFASLHDEDLKTSLDVNGLGSEVIFSKAPSLNASIKKFDIKKDGLPELTGDITTSLVFKKDGIDIKRLTIGSHGSVLRGSGFYSKGIGALKTEISLLIDSIKRILNLRQRGEGRISAAGEIRFEGIKPSDFAFRQWKDILIDLKLKGNFYIQTLMEMLKVKEKVEGLVDFHGEIKGNLSDISGVAKARLRNGNLFGVEIDALNCDISYKNGIMRFNNGDAELYNGNAKAEASITLPDVKPFILKIKFNSIDSKAAFKLIGWDPEIPIGKVEGELVTSGSSFSPDGWFVYNSQKSAVSSQQLKKLKDSGLRTPESRLLTENVLDRVRNIKGYYSLRGDVLSLSGLQISTSLSDLQAEGTINITKKNLNFKSMLSTKEVSDLILPYYNGLKGQGNLSGNITGTFDNPEISGKLEISTASIENYRASRITSLFSYNKNTLDVRELFIMSPEEEHMVKGRILFPEAKKLFDFSQPVYEMSANIKNADLRGVAQIFHKDLSVTGRMNADFRIGGKGKGIEIAGNAHATKATLYKVPLDSVSLTFLYLNKGLSLQKVVIKQGTSILTAEGKIASDERFSFRASSDKIMIKDLGFQYLPEGAFLSLRSEGQGTLKDPTIKLNAKVVGGSFRAKPIGNGIISGEVKNKNISLEASFFDEKVKLRGKGHLDNVFPWNADIDIQSGRYDAILSSIFKEIPEDLLLNLKGDIKMQGDRKNIRASAKISQLMFTLYGYSFSNDSEIKVQIDNRRLSFPAFSMRSGGTSLINFSGHAEIGREYDLQLKGRSSLTPFKILSSGVEHLTGEVDFDFSVIGQWDNPAIRGSLNISSASFGLKGNYPRITSISGYANIDGDKFVIKKLSGKIGGGDINISGLIYLKTFGIKRFSFESDLDNIAFSPSKDFNINFKGNLIYKGTPDAQSISGEIKIKSASYKERIEWKSWLLKTKTKEIPKAGISGIEETELNIGISGDENIYIDNNIARAPVTVDLVLRGTISHPVLFGRLESKEGIAYFRNNEFRIIHASAYFADPNRINPIMELAAETSIQGYHIKLNLDGQIEHFNLSLSSDPNLEEMDVLSLLTTGKVGKQLKGIESGIGAGEATSFLAGGLQDIFEERLKTIGGFERVQVGTYVSRVTGNVEPEVTVSKRLLSDRLYVTYSTPLGSAATEQQIFKLEYLLGRNISLVGVRDERGITGGDIKFRFEFK
jgi:hypothetical protein